MAIIAISRGTFSGGEGLARRLAERLGYQCLSREEVLQAAWGYAVPAEEHATATEKPPWLWERLLGERAAYLTFMRAALCDHARREQVVYHGHLGHLLLPGISHVIAVRVIADMEFRIQAAMRQQNFGREDAIAYIEKVDRERRQWTRFLYNVEWDDPSLYDVVFNLSRMRLATACEVVAHLTEQEEFKPTPESAKAMQDLALQSRVWAALVKDFRTRGADLKVTADGGVVTITGTTQLPAVGDLAPALVRRVEGVKEVRCEIQRATPLPRAG